MVGSARRGRARGLTLLEVLLSMALMSLLMLTLFAFTSTAMQTEMVGRELATKSQLARVVLDRIAGEIRQAAVFGRSISGDKNSIRILTTRLPDREVFEIKHVKEWPRTAEYDLAEIRYYLKIYEDEYVELEDGTEVPMVAGLYRREWKVLGHEGRPSPTQGMSSLPQAVKITVGYKELELEPVIEAEEEDEVIDLNPGREEVFAPEIKALRFAYHDGRNWVSKWAYREDELSEEEDESVSETIMTRDEEFEEEEEYHPDRYTVVVRLYQSDPTGLGSKMVRIEDEIREQFGGMGGEGGLDALGGMDALGGLGGSGGAGGLGGLSDKIGDLQRLGGAK